MVLSSQVARPDVLRRFATTRRRRHPLRNALLVVAAIGTATWVIWPGSDTGGKATEVAGVRAAAEQTPAVAAGQGSGALPVPPMLPATPAAELEAMHRRAQAENARIEAFLLNSSTKAPTPAVPAPAVSAQAPAPAISDAKPVEAAKPAAVASPVAPTKPDSIEKTAPAASDKPVAADAKVPSLTLAMGPSPATTGHDIAAAARRIAEAAATAPGAAGTSFRQGMIQVADGKLIEGRKTLSRVLTSGDPSITASDARTIRDTLASINKSLVFSDRVVEGDTIAQQHVVASGELLSIIARKYKITYQFIEQINSVDARRIRVGQKLKVITGPFHAVVDKSDYRMDVFAKDPDGTSIYITSFTVGVGKDDSTPIGSFICRSGGKLENPAWTHPRTGEYFAADDVKNPIGEYWIALQGTDDHTKGVRGYGIHGTIEPDSVGKQASLGCVRMLAKDIEQVYKLLVDGQSTVMIQP